MKASSLTDTLYQKLERRILSGEIGPGARMPTQKEIALEENVSRTVVREAVARLEARGYAVARHGSGVFVSPDARFRAFQIAPAELAELSDVIKLLEMRLAVEAETAALAASRRTASDLGAMRDALARIDAVSDDPVAAAEADMSFHLAIARATANDYFVRIVDFLGLRLVPPRSLYLRGAPEAAHRSYSIQVRAEHEAIVDAIARLDPDAARNAARRHMQGSLGRHSELSDAVRRASHPSDMPDH